MHPSNYVRKAGKLTLFYIMINVSLLTQPANGSQERTPDPQNNKRNFFQELKKKDGLVKGNGTKENPFIIKANYYYYELDREVMNCFNDALDDYNNGGNAWEIKKNKEPTVFVKLDLRVERRDHSLTAVEIVSPDIIDSLHHFGNIVLTEETTQEYYGEAKNFTIAININRIKERVEDWNGPANYKKSQEEGFIKGVFIHELGHNLGGNHGDKGDAMMENDLAPYQNNGGTPRGNFSKVNATFIGILISRIDSPYLTGYKNDIGFLNAVKRYGDSLRRFKKNKIQVEPQWPDSVNYGTCGKLFYADSLHAPREKGIIY